MTAVVQPAAGPHRSVDETPVLASNAVRRTTSTDVLGTGGFVVTKDEGAARAAAQQDVCAGWAVGGEVVEQLRADGVTAVPFGPQAPPITDSGDRWHALGDPPVGTVRRLRCLDVGASIDDPSNASVRSHFRDSYVGEDEEMVMHEYLVQARFDLRRLVLEAVDVDPRVLPWRSCPAAAPSASALLGTRVDELPAKVRAELVGPSTCTHLNSTMRALADVQPLLHALDRRGS